MNPLTDIIPAAYRKYLYALYGLACLIAGAMQIGGANVGATTEVLAYVGIGIGATAASNTAVEKPDERGVVAGVSGLIAVLLAVALVLVILWLVGVHVRVG